MMSAVMTINDIILYTMCLKIHTKKFGEGNYTGYLRNAHISITLKNKFAKRQSPSTFKLTLFQVLYEKLQNIYPIIIIH